MVISNPECLLISLDRLAFGAGKTDVAVEYPNELAWLERGKYQLLGVVHHTGDVANGHFLATCRLGGPGDRSTIYHFNDQKEPQQKEEGFMTNHWSQRNACLLLYELKTAESAGSHQEAHTSMGGG